MENELSRQRPLIFLQLSHLLLLIQFVALAIVKLMPRPSAPASNDAIAQALGLYGAIIIDPADAQDEVKADHEYVVQLQESLTGKAYLPSDVHGGGLANYFTINGKAYPSTDTIHMKVGETLKVRFYWYP
jgi:FtsP/CotA-like multicopper oxidase with cupredoxin domain